MVDVQPTNQQPMSDDQELAKVLAGVNNQTEDTAAPVTVEEPVAPVASPEPTDESDGMGAIANETPAVESPVADFTPQPASGADSSLDSIKKDALLELRPLVDKLQLNPEEKFDTYLLLLRSTDDKELIAPAHEAAKNIVDETKRAQALLDVIKEIDFLSGQTPQI